jgi:hypothetical protein
MILILRESRSDFGSEIKKCKSPNIIGSIDENCNARLGTITSQ